METAIIGRTLSHYRVLEMAGRGGMSDVYRAEDTVLGREVALKLLPPELSLDRDRLERLRREARALAALNHPNIVTIYEVAHEIDEDSGERFFLVMEWVSGRTLRDEIRPDGLALPRFLEIAVALSDAVGAAHKQGITHRDLKPENIMLTQEGRVKVLDFGLAKLSSPPSDREPSETTTEALQDEKLVGTLSYMSPEQIRCEVVDHRSDIFSLGIVLFEMITGRHPFPGATSVASAFSILRGRPDSIKKLRWDVPDELERIVASCLKSDPKERLQSTKRLHERLEILREVISSSGGNLGRALELRARRRRQRGWLIAGAGVLAAVVALGGWMVRARGGTTSQSRPVHLAVKEQPLLPGQRESGPYASAFVPVLEERLSGLEGVFLVHTEDLQPTIPPQGPEPEFVLQTDFKRQGDSIRASVRLVDGGSGEVVGGEVLQGSASESGALVDRVGTMTAQLLRDHVDLNARYRPRANGTEVPEAFDLYLQAWAHMRDAETADGHDDALEALARAIDLDPGFAAAQVLKGRALLVGARNEGDSDVLEQARDACARAIEIDPRWALAHICVADTDRMSGKTLDAVDSYVRAIELDGDQVDAYTGLREAYLELGMPPAAEAMWKRIVRQNPYFWDSRYQLAFYYHYRGDYEAALGQYELALALAPNNFTVAYSMGGAQYYLGRYLEAALSLEHSLRIRPDYRAFSNLGYNYLLLRRYDDSIRAFERAAEFEHANRIVWGNLGKAYSRVEGRDADAAEVLGRAVEMCRTRLETDPDDADTMTQMAHYLALLGEREESLATLAAALELRHGNAHDFYTKALIHLELGDRETALDALAQALAAGYPKAEVRMTPELDGLRDDVRYREILEIPEWQG